MEQLIDSSHRHKIILQKLESSGAVTVADLSALLKTSEVTVRNDLKTLEEDGLLVRIRGGAVSVHHNEHENTLFSRVPKVCNMELKHSVAREAAKLINDGESLIVTSGATPHLTILYAWNRKNLKIVSDSVLIAEDLCTRQDYQTIILGGELLTREYFVHGRDAVSQASRYMVDKAIITADGVDPEAGLSNLKFEGADTLKSILARARYRIVVADITKIGEEKFCHVADMSIINMLVTNSTNDPKKIELLKKIEKSGVKIKYAN